MCQYKKQAVHIYFADGARNISMKNVIKYAKFVK